MHALRDHLDALDPRLFPVLIALVVWGIIAGWRKLSPGSFDLLPRRLQVLPAVLLGIGLSAAAGRDVLHMMLDAFFGALSGLKAMGLHEVLKQAAPPQTTERKAP